MSAASSGASTFTDIEVETSDPVCIIRLNRPERLNALTYPMLAAIRSAVDAAAADPAVVAIIVTGNGRGFCSGLDADVLKATTEAGSAGRAKPAEGELAGMFSYFLHVPKPIIAAVNGVAAGGGFVLAAMADLRVAGPSASFTTIFSKRGLTSEHGTSWILPKIVGTARALDLLWSSRRIDGAEAYRIGLADFLCDDGEDPVERARAYIADLAANISPASIANMKQLVYRHADTPYPEALAEADFHTWQALDRPDSTEGAMSLIEKRPSNFARWGTS